MQRFAFFLLALSALAGCRKDDILICPPATTTGPATLAAVMAAAPPVQTLSFDLSQAQTLRTAKGATLAFGAQAFLLPTGTRATGNATLRVREIYEVADMVLANMPTTTYNGAHLVSGGEFHIQVWQGTTRLRLAPTSPAGAKQYLMLTSPVPTSGLDTTPMQLWQIPATTPLNMALPDSSGWSLAFGAPRITSAPVGSATGSSTFYTTALPLDSIGWWNIDQFWSAYQRNGTGQVAVEVPAGASETRVYFRPIGFNGLARCVSTSPTRWASNLPLNADVVAVVLQTRDNQLYYGTQRLTTRASLVVTPPLQALSAAEIVQRIRQL